ncbi:unnamed protein product [Arabis nemorensis]|uniref:Large ribosomal subunit protein uL15/eL18 domain-containing protein n=1 Tax=Arabis nemorensis TaxID=586526 RepID=A0A565CPH2_9BRAS|nr:unnamed protein product [Arabis nemorensis]
MHVVAEVPWRRLPHFSVTYWIPVDYVASPTKEVPVCVEEANDVVEKTQLKASGTALLKGPKNSREAVKHFVPAPAAHNRTKPYIWSS